MSNVLSSNEETLWQSDTHETGREHLAWYLLRYYGWVVVYCAWVVLRKVSDGSEYFLEAILFNIALLAVLILIYDPIKLWKGSRKPERKLKLTSDGFRLQRRDGHTERYDWADHPEVSLKRPAKWTKPLNWPARLHVVKHKHQPSEGNLRWWVAQSRIAEIEDLLSNRSNGTDK